MREPFDAQEFREETVRALNTEIPTSFSLRDLLVREFMPQQWIVPNVLPEGLTILGGRPKVGKSWMLLDLAIAVASGGVFLGEKADPGRVLYLALEDTPRRLQARARLLLGDKPFNDEAWDRLDLRFRWNRLDAGGFDGIKTWVAAHNNARLVLIDTYPKVRSATTSQRWYDDDYRAVEPLQQLAGEAQIGILGAHHLRKAPGDDWTDELSGSTGLTGAVDSVLVLQRERSRADAVLRGVGRDLDEYGLAVAFDASCGRWNAMGDAAEFRMSQERAAIAAYIAEAGPSSPKQAAEALGRTEGSTRKLMPAMVRSGELVTSGDGVYSLPRVGNSGNSGNGVLPL